MFGAVHGVIEVRPLRPNFDMLLRVLFVGVVDAELSLRGFLAFRGRAAGTVNLTDGAGRRLFARRFRDFITPGPWRRQQVGSCQVFGFDGGRRCGNGTGRGDVWPGIGARSSGSTSADAAAAATGSCSGSSNDESSSLFDQRLQELAGRLRFRVLAGSKHLADFFAADSAEQGAARRRRFPSRRLTDTGSTTSLLPLKRAAILRPNRLQTARRSPVVTARKESRWRLKGNRGNAARRDLRATMREARLLWRSRASALISIFKGAVTSISS